jgi:hypothetical protein
MPAKSLTAIVAVAAAVVLTVASDEIRSAPAHGPFVSTQPVIERALKRIARGSATWREAVDRLTAAGRTAVILTPGEVVVREASGAPAVFDASEMAEVSPVADRVGRVSAVLVVVNVDRLLELHDRRGSLIGEFEADLDRVLAHEVYGHAVPYLLGGHISARCPDPVPGQPAAEACAIRRENTIRAELRLGRRTDSAFGSLALARAVRD